VAICLARHTGHQRLVKLADQIVQRREWYWNLWSRRAELNEALMARVPGLREMVAAGAG
jgi:hypothetical protein